LRVDIHRVRASIFRPLLQYCERLGHSPSQLLDRAGIDAVAGTDPNTLVAVDRVVMLWMHAVALTGDEHLAMHVAEWTPEGSRSIMYFLFANALTVGDALRKVVTFYRSVGNTGQASIEEEESRVALRYDNVPGFTAQREAREWALVLAYCGVRSATGVDFCPESVELAYPAPVDISEHERIFRCPVLFERAASRLWLRREDWQRPTRHADPDLLRILESRAQNMADELPGIESIGSALRCVLSLDLEQGVPSVHDTARRLGLSSRTLQRRLAAEGLSFSDIVERTRADAARRLLKEQNLALVEVAELLGFSDQSAFTRAFRAWSGTTPAEFRRKSLES
jgi:AraC-like DNA-binding protein